MKGSLRDVHCTVHVKRKKIRNLVKTEDFCVKVRGAQDPIALKGLGRSILYHSCLGIWSVNNNQMHQLKNAIFRNKKFSILPHSLTLAHHPSQLHINR